MNRANVHFRFIIVMLLCVAFVGGVTAQVPSMMSYQGLITSGGEPVDGTGYFKFALIDVLGDAQWTHDDTFSGPTGEPEGFVEAPVEHGLFTVILGDPMLPDMQPLSAKVFANNSPLSLRIWFSEDGVTFEQLVSDQQITSAGYALQADRVPFSSIGPDELMQNAVSASHIANSAVTSSKLALNSVTAGAIESAAVSSNKIDWSTMPEIPVLRGYAEQGGFAEPPSATGNDAIAMGYGARATQSHATVGGGYENRAAGIYAALDEFVTLGGGFSNRASGAYSVISGGQQNESVGNIGAIGGGKDNLVTGYAGTVPGGLNNHATNHAFAAGRRAKAENTGAFVWADSADEDFASTAPDQFLVRAAGGMGINTNNPQATLHVGGEAMIGSNPAPARFGMQRVNTSSPGTLFALPGTEITMSWHDQTRMLTVSNEEAYHIQCAITLMRPGSTDLLFEVADLGPDESLSLANPVSDAAVWNVQVGSDDRPRGFTFQGTGWGLAINGLVTYWE